MYAHKYAIKKWCLDIFLPSAVVYVCDPDHERTQRPVEQHTAGVLMNVSVVSQPAALSARNLRRTAITSFTTACVGTCTCIRLSYMM